MVSYQGHRIIMNLSAPSYCKGVNHTLPVLTYCNSYNLIIITTKGLQKNNFISYIYIISGYS